MPAATLRPDPWSVNRTGVSLYSNSAHTGRRNYVGTTGCPGHVASYADAGRTGRPRAEIVPRTIGAGVPIGGRSADACVGRAAEGGTVSSDLEGFVSQPGRAEAVEAVQRQIVEQGVEYMYYQFVSVTGRIMGKGIPAAHWERIADAGFQLVYGSTANLFTDRHGNYIGYGPEARELVGHRRARDLQRAAVGPEDGPRVVHAVPGPGGGSGRRRVPHLRLPRQPQAASTRSSRRTPDCTFARVPSPR